MFDFLDLKSRHSKRRLIPFVASVGVLLLPGVVEAKTVYVNSAVKSPGKGATWATAYKYLRDALDQTQAGDQILIAKGTYYPDDGATGDYGNREMSFELKGQTLYGGFAGTETSISQRNPAVNTTSLSGAIWSGSNARDFYSLHVVIVKGDTTLHGLVVEDGHANGGHSFNYPRVTEYDQGGGFFVESGNILTLNDCIVRDNRALQHGGAIMIEDGKGKVIATNTRFEDNHIRLDYNITPGTSGGGAISGDVEATNCKFISNTVATVNFVKGTTSEASGGAIHGTVKALGCEFTSNFAYAFRADDTVIPTADGGAVRGKFTGSYCVFTRNEAFATVNEGISSGGALSGTVVNAFNCAFVENMSGTGILKEKERVLGGGGAVHTTTGDSTLANCTFVRNASEFRGGAVQGGFNPATDSLTISACTFLDNGVTDEETGAALSCGGMVRLMNSVLWYTADTASGLDQTHPVHLSWGGALRNSHENYPTPNTAAPNLLKGGSTEITDEGLADYFLVSPAIIMIDEDPLFTNVADPDGADNRWATADDGLRLTAGSPAIGKALDPRVANFVNLLPKDLNDVDGDGNVAERLPTDMIGLVRVQGGFVEMGAYEYGNLQNFAEIAVVEAKKEIFSGGARNFGSTRRGKKVEKTFTIRSTGTNQLGSIAFTLTGDKGFTVKRARYTLIEPGSSETFTVTFRPTKAGKYTAKLAILSNDANESPFNITLTGKCVDRATKSAGTKGKTPKETDGVTTGSGSGLPGFFLAAAPVPNSVATAAATTTVSTGADGAKYLTLTVVKSANWSGGTVEVSSDLLDWYSGEQHTTVLEDSATLLRVRDNTPVGTDGSRYIRLK